VLQPKPKLGHVACPQFHGTTPPPVDAASTDGAGIHLAGVAAVAVAAAAVAAAASAAVAFRTHTHNNVKYII